MSNFFPKKKAVIIGINYIETEGIALRGCANDAKLMALTLISHFDFNPSNILFLTDSEPDGGYDMLLDSNEIVSFYDNWPRDEIPPVKHHDSRIYPNKRNILTAINWLTRNAESGDILVFYFAGHGVQVDVLTSYEGEGYDEALLPADSTLYLASNGSDLDEYNVLLCSELRELLLCVPQDTQVNIILDCNGGQTILDPAGNINGLWYIKGVVTKGIWPFLSATNKVKRAQYKSSVFREEQMVHRLVRPRYVPCVQVGNTQNLKDPSLQSTQYVSLSCKGYCFSAAPWGEIAAEASLPLLSVSRKTQVTGIINKKGIDTDLNINNTLSTSLGESKLGVIEIPISKGGAYNVIHGVFTWSFCKAVSDIATGILQQGRPRNELSYKTIMARIREYVKCLKLSILPHLDQIPEITIHSGGAGTVSEYFCTPFGGDKEINFDYYNYFMFTDNSIYHLKKSQNFLTPQEAYNIMLKSTKNEIDNSLNNVNGCHKFFSSVNRSVLKNKTPINGSPPTFRDNYNRDNIDNNNCAEHSNNDKEIRASEISNEKYVTNIQELPPSSVNLVPPTASIFGFNHSLNSKFTNNYVNNIENSNMVGFNTTNYNLNINNDNYIHSRIPDDNLKSPFIQGENKRTINSNMNTRHNPILINSHFNSNVYNNDHFMNNSNNTHKFNNNTIPSNHSLNFKQGLIVNNGSSIHHQLLPHIPQFFPIQQLACQINNKIPLNSNRNIPIRNTSNNSGNNIITYPPIMSYQSILNKHFVVPVNSLPNSNLSLNSNNINYSFEKRHFNGQNSNNLNNDYSSSNFPNSNQNVGFQSYPNYCKYNFQQYPPFQDNYDINVNNNNLLLSNQLSGNKFYPSSFINN
ncbi:metacaspase-like protein [Cryptosporidium ryanae]|uniref:metacaspase-like protein n=1 Tax=Cryptosporidium ryanae TaxID=515981 RepID=UPI00351A13B2|nr:metacaspase-like protein [Cryptosporidium ryanae]